MARREVARRHVIGHHTVQRLVHDVVVHQHRGHLALDQAHDHVVGQIAAVGEDHAVDLSAHAVHQPVDTRLATFEQV